MKSTNSIGLALEASSHLVLQQNRGQLSNALNILKICAKKRLHVVLLGIFLVLDGWLRSINLYALSFPRRKGTAKVFKSYNHSKYETQPLQEALISAFSEEEYLFGGPRSYQSYGSEVKVAVTTTSAAGNPVVLANYNRLCNEKCLWFLFSEYFLTPSLICCTDVSKYLIISKDRRSRNRS